jgi:hypothetical protein
VLENEIIGITGVFVLTFFLILLYHLMSKIGHGRRRHGAQTKQVNGRDQDRRPENETNKSSDRDDAWLLWDPQPDGQADQSRRSKYRLGGEREHGSKRRAPLR